MAKFILTALMVLLAGCTSTPEPYFDTKLSWQNDRGSDWMIRSARPWVEEGPWKWEMGVGVEWEKGLDCPFIQVSQFQSLNWVHFGCAKRWGGKPDNIGAVFAQVDLRHHVDGLSSWWLNTDRKDWQGHNPFIHLRAGVEWKRIGPRNHKIFRVRCPVLATGRSLFQGAPFESEKGAPDLYWSRVECNARFGGQ